MVNGAATQRISDIAQRIPQRAQAVGTLDPPPRFADLGGGRRVAYFDVGEGPVVVCAHGIPGSRQDFKYLAPELVARGLRVVSFDWPGFGDTPFAAFPARSATNRAALFAKLARTIGYTQYALVAHSFGASACYVGAAHDADNVTLLVGINPIGAVRHKAFPAMVPKLVMRGGAQALRRLGDGSALHRRVVAAYRQLGFRMPLSAEELALHVELIAALDFVHIRRALAQIRAPVQFFWAQDDPIVDGRSHEATARLVEASTALMRAVVPEGGHYLQKHAAPLIADHIARVLLPE